MSLEAALSIAGLFVGPIAAVLISLWLDDRRQAYARRVASARGLIVGRLNFADPAFQLAINTIPIDFAKNDAVLSAWEAYLDAVNRTPAEDPAVQAGWQVAQQGLTKAVLIAVGYSEREASQMIRAPYAARSYVDDILLRGAAMRAVVQMAENTGRLATLNEQIAASALSSQSGRQGGG